MQWIYSILLDVRISSSFGTDVGEEGKWVMLKSFMNIWLKSYRKNKVKQSVPDFVSREDKEVNQDTITSTIF